MRYSLWRTRDNRGDSGPMSTILRRNPDTGEVEYKHTSRPEVGWQLQVGSIYGRTYASQDYWHCTEVTEILEDVVKEEMTKYSILGKEKTATDRVHLIRFKTLNSEYEWRQYL